MGKSVNWKKLKTSFDVVVKNAKADKLGVNHIESFFRQLYPGITKHASESSLLNKFLLKRDPKTPIMLTESDGSVILYNFIYGVGQARGCKKRVYSKNRMGNCLGSASFFAYDDLHRSRIFKDYTLRYDPSGPKLKLQCGMQSAKEYCTYSKRHVFVTCFYGASKYICKWVPEDYLIVK